MVADLHPVLKSLRFATHHERGFLGNIVADSKNGVKVFNNGHFQSGERVISFCLPTEGGVALCIVKEREAKKRNLANRLKKSRIRYSRHIVSEQSAVVLAPEEVPFALLHGECRIKVRNTGEALALIPVPVSNR